MNGKDRTCPCRQSLLDAPWVKVECPLVGLHWYDARPRSGDGQPGCDIGIGRNNDLSTRAYAHSSEREIQRIQPVGDTYAESDANVSGEF